MPPRRRRPDGNTSPPKASVSKASASGGGGGCGAGCLCKCAVAIAVAGGVLAAALLLTSDPYREQNAGLPEPLQPFRPLPIRLLNALQVVVAATLGVDLIPLSADGLVAAACAKFAAEFPGEAAPATARGQPAVCDFGEAEWGKFREGLGVFVRSLAEEAELTLIGRVFATHRLSMLLDQRLRLVRQWRNDASAAAAAAAAAADLGAVDAPLFVVGLPRTGTSFLHTLLSQDTESFRSPLNWMVVDPGPPALFGTVDDDATTVQPGDTPHEAVVRAARVAEATRNLAQFKSIAPGVRRPCRPCRPCRPGRPGRPGRPSPSPRGHRR
eukprot:SAG22_NODE_118_length_19263_cov_16.155813_8_plen_326_part_00